MSVVLTIPDDQLAQSFLHHEGSPFRSESNGSTIRKWRGRVISSVTGLLSISIRTINIAPWTNGLSSFGIGLSAISLIESFIDKKNLLVVQKIALTVLGQMPMFFLTQVYENTESKRAQTAVVDTIIALLGANIFTYIHQFIRNRPERVEGHGVQQEGGVRFRGIFISSRIQNIAKSSFAAFGLYGYLKIQDHVYKMLSFFSATFLASQVIGDITGKFVDKKITLNESPTGTVWRRVKYMIIMAGALAIPLSLIPWKADAQSEARQAQLPFIGIVLGFFQGFWHQAMRRRLRYVPVEELQEMKEGSPREDASSFWKLSHKIYSIAVPLINVCGMIGFYVWQMGWDLGDAEDAKKALTSLFVGFMATLGMGTLFDQLWDPKVRHRVKDYAQVFLTVPAVLGCSIALIYSVFTNAINMADRGITREYSWLQNTAWFFYGSAMALELIKTSGKRIGSVLFPPLLAFVNGSLTLKLRITGQIQ